ncbi:MAG: Na+/H+ antiporter NhaA [Gemmatimonadetes bacterium]|nr:Na+/H+ antiporter NhaA [Gemmatimonadota bacterium]
MTNGRPLAQTFKDFFDSKKSGGITLVVCTVISLVIANSAAGGAYVDMWHVEIGGLSLEHWINDGLMAVFFLLIGLELEREFYVGELSDFRSALLPIVAAGGGVAAPALIHLSLNMGSPTQAGIGITMATDIAFALGVLALLGSRVPASLKIFLAALAVMDDLVAVIVIAVFYTSDLSVGYLAGALGVFGVLVALNRLRVRSLAPYLGGGVLMWLLMYQSGVHATITGVLLAFAVPFAGRSGDDDSPSHRLEHALHRPVALAVLPLFALANTGIVIGAGALDGLVTSNGLGIMAGLFVGKPTGIALACVAAVAAGLCRLPGDLRWGHIVGAGMLGGIGFTMSIFITNLAFAGQTDMINASKLAILVASLMAGTAGCLWLLAVSGGGSEPKGEAPA